MSSQEIQEIEVGIEQMKEAVELGNMLDRLHSNRYFKKVVLEGYFEKNAIRLAHLYGEPNLSDKGRENVLREIDSIGKLRSYFIQVFREAEAAAAAIHEAEQAVEEIRDAQDSENAVGQGQDVISNPNVGVSEDD